MENKNINKIIEPYQLTNNFKKRVNELKKDPNATSLDFYGDLNKLFLFAKKYYMNKGRLEAMNDNNLINKPYLNEEKLAYMAQKNPNIIKLINKFNLELT